MGPAEEETVLKKKREGMSEAVILALYISGTIL